MSIKIENAQIFGWEGAIRGARNPMNSWDKSDSWFIGYGDDYHLLNHESIDRSDIEIDDEFFDRLDKADPNGQGYLWQSVLFGPNDYKLLMNLCKGGTEEAKWRRMVHVQMDITAPLYWWKEFETYKVGTTSNSCSTMHKIHSKEFTLDDFSHEHLGFTIPAELNDGEEVYLNLWPVELNKLIETLNITRARYEQADPSLKKDYWWQMIQLLPTSYNQRRTIDLNYEVLASQYRQRKEHKLDEWREYCEWIKTLPYSEFITMEE